MITSNYKVRTDIETGDLDKKIICFSHRADLVSGWNSYRRSFSITEETNYFSIHGDKEIRSLVFLTESGDRLQISLSEPLLSEMMEKLKPALKDVQKLAGERRERQAHLKEIKEKQKAMDALLSKLGDEATGSGYETMVGERDAVEIHRNRNDPEKMSVNHLPIDKVKVFCVPCKEAFDIYGGAKKATGLYTEHLDHEIILHPTCHAHFESGIREGEKCGANATVLRERPHFQTKEIVRRWYCKRHLSQAY